MAPSFLLERYKQMNVADSDITGRINRAANPMEGASTYASALIVVGVWRASLVLSRHSVHVGSAAQVKFGDLLWCAGGAALLVCVGQWLLTV